MQRKILSMAVGLLLTANTYATEILVPAYFYPSADATQSYWDEMTSAVNAGARITAIMNPNNGPGIDDTPNSDYTNAIEIFRNAGGKVIGYVPTSYADQTKTTMATVINNAAKYSALYHVDGIFLDEMNNKNTVTNIDYYHSIYSGIKNINPALQVFGNPGVGTPEAFFNPKTLTADTLVTFENQTDYRDAMPDTWTQHYSSNHFANLLYNLASTSDMLKDLALAQSRNVGYIYITNDNGNNPWDTLPSYWNEEVAALSSLPEPSGAALFFSMLTILLLRRNSEATRTLHHKKFTHE